MGSQPGVDVLVPDPLAAQRELRNALGRFATGVTLITCLNERGERVGLTANSFNALSLQPPLVLWSLRSSSANAATFRQARHFVVNVLAEAQVDLSRRFASRVENKFAEGQWAAGVGGAPVLAGCAAVFECETLSHQDAGDHVLFVGRVLALAESPVPPLLFQAGHYRMLGEIL